MVKILRIYAEDRKNATAQVQCRKWWGAKYVRTARTWDGIWWYYLEHGATTAVEEVCPLDTSLKRAHREALALARFKKATS